jgi:hypothetical protein
MMKSVGKSYYHYDNPNSISLDANNNFPIPVLIKGQSLSRKRCPVNSSRSTNDKVLIIGDSHIRLCATNVKSEINVNYDVQGLVKPGAGSGTLVNSATSDIANLTKNDVIFCGGANDIAKNNSNMALRNIRNFVNSNNHTNLVLLSVPHRSDLMQSSCVNNEIKSFNRKLRKSMRAFNHASILEITSDRTHFTKHGFHLNSVGMEVLSKQIVSHIYATQDQEKNPPIILGWNPDVSHLDLLHQGSVINRTSTRTKKTPSTKSDDFFMVNSGLNLTNEANTKRVCQTKDRNFHKINPTNKGTAYFKTYHQNIRRLGKKPRELLSHLHPGFPHVLCLTEHHLKYSQLERVYIEGYKLGAQFCRQIHEKGSESYVFVSDMYLFLIYLSVTLMYTAGCCTLTLPSRVMIMTRAALYTRAGVKLTHPD